MGKTYYGENFEDCQRRPTPECEKECKYIRFCRIWDVLQDLQEEVFYLKAQLSEAKGSTRRTAKATH